MESELEETAYEKAMKSNYDFVDPQGWNSDHIKVIGEDKKQIGPELKPGDEKNGLIEAVRLFGIEVGIGRDNFVCLGE